VIETQEFPKMGRAHQVVVVPKIWINERTFLEGQAPESVLIHAIRQAMDPTAPAGRLRSPGRR